MQIILKDGTQEIIRGFNGCQLEIDVEKTELLTLMDTLTADKLSEITIVDGDVIIGKYENKKVKCVTYDGTYANFLLVDVDILGLKVAELEQENAILKEQLEQTQEVLDFLLMQ